MPARRRGTLLGLLRSRRATLRSEGFRVRLLTSVALSGRWERAAERVSVSSPPNSTPISPGPAPRARSDQSAAAPHSGPGRGRPRVLRRTRGRSTGLHRGRRLPQHELRRHSRGNSQRQCRERDFHARRGGISRRSLGGGRRSPPGGRTPSRNRAALAGAPRGRFLCRIPRRSPRCRGDREQGRRTARGSSPPPGSRWLSIPPIESIARFWPPPTTPASTSSAPTPHLLDAEPDFVIAAVEVDVAEAMLRVAREVHDLTFSGEVYAFDLGSGVLDVQLNPKLGPSDRMSEYREALERARSRSPPAGSRSRNSGSGGRPV